MTHPKTIQIIAEHTERVEIEKLREKVGMLFSALEELLESNTQTSFGVWSPRVDLCETQTEILVKAELPGVEQENIEITLTSSELKIEGEKFISVKPPNISHYCCERLYGKFSGIIPIRWDINIKKTKARFDSGLLEITLPKIAENRRGTQFKVPVSS